MLRAEIDVGDGVSDAGSLVLLALALARCSKQPPPIQAQGLALVRRDGKAAAIVALVSWEVLEPRSGWPQAADGSQLVLGPHSDATAEVSVPRVVLEQMCSSEMAERHTRTATSGVTSHGVSRLVMGTVKAGLVVGRAVSDHQTDDPVWSQQYCARGIRRSLAFR